MKTLTVQTFRAFEQTVVDAERAAEAARLHAKEAARVQRAMGVARCARA